MHTPADAQCSHSCDKPTMLPASLLLLVLLTLFGAGSDEGGAGGSGVAGAGGQREGSQAQIGGELLPSAASPGPPKTATRKRCMQLREGHLQGGLRLG